MIDRDQLFGNILMFAIAAVVLYAAGEKWAATIITIPVLILFIVVLSMKKQVLKIRLRDILENHQQANELQQALSEDAKLRECVSYLYHLGSAELLQVGRIVTELRDSGNQSWLREISTQVRKEDKA